MSRFTDSLIVSPLSDGRTQNSDRLHVQVNREITKTVYVKMLFQKYESNLT